jgi:hypothetical protein
LKGFFESEFEQLQAGHAVFDRYKHGPFGEVIRAAGPMENERGASHRVMSEIPLKELDRSWSLL